MRGMPSVATDSTWVSPRWKRPVPCAVGEHADLGRQRPDVGRAATVDAHAFVDDAAAHDFLLQASGTPASPRCLRRRTGPGASAVPTSATSSSASDLVEPGVAVVLVGDRHRLGRLVFACVLHRGEAPRACSRSPGVYSIGSIGPCAVHVLRAQLRLQLDRRRDPLLRRFETLGDDLLGDLRRALFVELPRASRCHRPRPS